MGIFPTGSHLCGGEGSATYSCRGRGRKRQETAQGRAGPVWRGLAWRATGRAFTYMYIHISIDSFTLSFDLSLSCIVCSVILQVFSLEQWWWAHLTLTPSHSSTPHSALYTTHCMYNTPKLVNSSRWRERQTNYHTVCCKLSHVHVHVGSTLLVCVIYCTCIIATQFSFCQPSRGWAESMWRHIACSVQPGGACESQTCNDYTLWMWYIIPPPLHQSRLYSGSHQ